MSVDLREMLIALQSCGCNVNEFCKNEFMRPYIPGVRFYKGYVRETYESYYADNLDRYITKAGMALATYQENEYFEAMYELKGLGIDAEFADEDKLNKHIVDITCQLVTNE